MNLFMDDVRPVPVGWTVARTVEAAMALLSEGNVEQCSLDHDMGACAECTAQGKHFGDLTTPDTTFQNWCPHALDGTKLVRWMVETGHWPSVKPTVHSANPSGRVRMRSLIDRFFGQPALGPMF